jgi:hypothetical protein
MARAVRRGPRGAAPLAAVVAAVLVAVACTGGTSDPEPADPVGAALAAPTEAACALAPSELRRIWQGTQGGTSGNVQIVPAEPNYLGAGFSHAGPWDYVQRVPIFFYGPGHVPAVGRIDARATLADIAPTTAALLGYDFDAPDGRVLERAVRPGTERPPRLIVTVVWDAAGHNVLDAWSEEWPVLAGLIDQGAWFEGGELGSSPSNTPPTHATIGTGAFPRRHGVVDLYQMIDGEIVKPQDEGPGQLALPTLADLYDVSMGNEPLVGVVATLGTHTGMIGHGAMWEGGDRDIAVMREQEDAETGGAEGVRWQLTTGMAPSFRMPDYVNEVPGIEQDLQALDQADGMLDGRWGEHPFSALQDGFQTPARTPYQTRIVQEVIRREGFGADDVPDLLFVNYKAIDTVGHIWSLNSDEMRQTVRVQDASLGDLIAFLDAEVGRGEWAMVLTADHGHQYDPQISGAFQIGVRPLTRYLEDRFGSPDAPPVVVRVRPTQLWIDEQVLAGHGVTLDDVAVAVMEATRADTADQGVEVGSDPDERVFAAAFPTASMASLPCLPATERG